MANQTSNQPDQQTIDKLKMQGAREFVERVDKKIETYKQHGYSVADALKRAYAEEVGNFPPVQPLNPKILKELKERNQ